MLIFSFIIVSWVSTRIGLHAFMLNKHISFLIQSVWKCSLSLRIPVCSDWSAHTRLSEHCSPCVQSALSCFKLPVSLTSTVSIGINDANVRHCDVAWCQKVTDLRRDFWWGVLGALFSVEARSFASDFLAFEIFHVHKNLQFITHWRKREKMEKHDRSPLKCH